MIRIDIPGTGPVEIKRVMFDYNGTIAVDGRLIDGGRTGCESSG